MDQLEIWTPRLACRVTPGSLLQMGMNGSGRGRCESGKEQTTHFRWLSYYLLANPKHEEDGEMQFPNKWVLSSLDPGYGHQPNRPPHRSLLIENGLMVSAQRTTTKANHRMPY